MPAKSLELKHTIKFIQKLTTAIDGCETAIKTIMDRINPPILSIPSISYRMGTTIITEISDICRFDFPDKILAYARLSHLLTNQISLVIAAPIWKSVLQDIFDMHYSMLQNMSVTRIPHLPPIWLRSELKETL